MSPTERKSAAKKSDPRRSLPSVERLAAACRDRDGTLPEAVIVAAVRRVVADARERLRRRSEQAGTTSEREWIDETLAVARRQVRGGSVRVLNATGVLLHTNLGRAPLAKAAREAAHRAALGYLDLEYDLERGKRSVRGAVVETQLRSLTGAEAALVVNNNAAAVLLALSALAGGRRALVSRGELIEIGGSYRLPDVFEKSGARLHEVGTTNRTHLRDYERPLAAKKSRAEDPIALVVRAHPSNYRTLGFTARPETRELAALCRRHRVPLVEDLGSGALIDLAPWGFDDEPTVPEVLHDGVDLVTFSGDKLLGGPQAGILLGKKKLVDACRKDPLARALRVDKGTLAALEATLALYFEPERAVREIPVLRMLSVSAKELDRRARSLARKLSGLSGWDVQTRPAEGETGGGSLPLHRLPTRIVTLRSDRHPAQALEASLRGGQPPLVARVQSGAVWLDVRTLLEESEREVADAVRAAAERLEG